MGGPSIIPVDERVLDEPDLWNVAVRSLYVACD